MQTNQVEASSTVSAVDREENEPSVTSRLMDDSDSRVQACSSISVPTCAGVHTYSKLEAAHTNTSDAIDSKAVCLQYTPLAQPVSSTYLASPTLQHTPDPPDNTSLSVPKYTDERSHTQHYKARPDGPRSAPMYTASTDGLSLPAPQYTASSDGTQPNTALVLPAPPSLSTEAPLVVPLSSISMTRLNGLLVTPSGGFDNKSDTSSYFGSVCKICHQPSELNDPLISPCRCAGSLQYIHGSCLTKWLEILSKKSRKPPRCELCNYQYHRHKKFRFTHLRLPHISKHDKILHLVFLVNLLLMFSCAVATVMCFLSDKNQINKLPRSKMELSTEEIITLSCGVLFFVSFFISMSVQIKAKHTVYQLFVKFITQNMEWEIDAYDESKDFKKASFTKTKGLPVNV